MKYFEEEIEYEQSSYMCCGEFTRTLTDTSVGMVPYGDSEVWHPGDGLQPEVELYLHDITNEDKSLPIAVKHAAIEIITERLKEE